VRHLGQGQAPEPGHPVLVVPEHRGPGPQCRLGPRPGDPGGGFIRHAQAAGLTLEAIRQILEIRDGGQPPCVHMTDLIAQRLAEVEARLAELTRTRDQLVVLAARAAEQDPADCRGYCSIIAGLTLHRMSP
jgi:hypothetical protein